jgi:hypothetical protein
MIPRAKKTKEKKTKVQRDQTKDKKKVTSLQIKFKILTEKS